MTSQLTSEPLAHLAEDGRPHFLIEHLQCVAALARDFTRSFDPNGVAEIAGLWHDLGKYIREFQRRIRLENGFEAHIESDGQQLRDHSTAGALLAFQRGSTNNNVAGIAVALAIAGHHAGLADLEPLLNERFKERGHLLGETFKGVPPPPEDLLEKRLPQPPHVFASAQDDEIKRRFEMWTRMIFSALCDADFLDTEAFYDMKRSRTRGGYPAVDVLADKLGEHLVALEARSPHSEVNRVRREIRQACISAASSIPGCFSLNVPTGGGKTLASLQFALLHARQHELDRVIVAIPYTSIIEQTAEVYRRALGADAVVEHHSALESETESPRNRIASENWDAPVIVTTTVQLFESLFANRPSSCRKLHRLSRSVVVLDEAQTLPPKMLASILDGLQTLASDFGASVVISTATQPALRRSGWLKEGLRDVREIVPDEIQAFERLRRVRVRWPNDVNEPASFDDLADALAREPEVLCIVHLRKDAHDLCSKLDQRLGDESTIHLSALMCAEHRSHVLDELKRQSSRRVVATQLVEAGVDFDFPIVYRALGGLDALAQAAGRCNREGKLEHGELRVFVAPTKPPLGVPRTALDIAKVILSKSESLDLFAPATFKEYFQRLYQAANLDGKEIQKARAALEFKQVAQRFRLIESDWASPLIVPYGSSAERVADLETFGPSRDRLRALQRFTISVSTKQLDGWRAQGAVRRVADTVDVLDGPFARAYSKRFGLIVDEVGIATPEDLIVSE